MTGHSFETKYLGQEILYGSLCRYRRRLVVSHGCTAFHASVMVGEGFAGLYC